MGGHTLPTREWYLSQCSTGSKPRAGAEKGDTICDIVVDLLVNKKKENLGGIWTRQVSKRGKEWSKKTKGVTHLNTYIHLQKANQFGNEKLHNLPKDVGSTILTLGFGSILMEIVGTLAKN